jgi:glycosyltransferase involved in cell wall biosynthesis
MNDVNEKLAVASRTVARTGPGVLQVLPRLDRGGAGRGIVDLTRYLVERGWRPLVVSNGGAAEAEVAGCGARIFRMPLDSNNPLTIHANIRRLQRLIRDHDVRLVHARSRAPAWSACYAARRCKVPFVTTIQGVYGGDRDIFKRPYNAVMARGDRVIAVSHHVAEHVKRQHGVPDGRLRVIYRGVDMRRFDPDAIDPTRVEALAERWRVRPGTKVLWVPAHAVRGRGPQVLLQALGRLQRRNFVCLISGGSGGRADAVGEIEGPIGKLGLGSVARIVSPTDDHLAALMLADVVVIAASAAYEPLARIAVEAQALGRPVVVTDTGGLAEMLMPAATGWLVKPDDADALADALELALAMPAAARARLAVRARRFVARNFSLEQTGAATIRVYRELLAGDAPDAGDEILP